jgi:hypothetical protein
VQRVDEEDLGLDGRDRAAPAEDGSFGSDEGVGRGVGQGRGGDRLAEAATAEGLSGVGEEMGSRTHLFLGGPKPQDELMDYERLPGTSEAFIYVGMRHLMVRRLARV